jgi:hypothetical protein
LFFDDDAYVYARQDAKETLVIGINRASEEKKLTIPAAAINVRSGSNLVPLLGTRSGQTTISGDWTITLPSKSAVAYAIK